jgi:hypothetical protein
MKKRKVISSHKHYGQGCLQFWNVKIEKFGRIGFVCLWVWVGFVSVALAFVHPCRILSSGVKSQRLTDRNVGYQPSSDLTCPTTEDRPCSRM